MADVSFAAQAKSDQLNAVDIQGIEIVITVSSVTVSHGDQQPVIIRYHGDNNRPWKPSKGMIRILQHGWGSESDNWVGKSVKLYCDESVKYAGKEVGGIRIKGMSDIQSNGFTALIALNRSNRVPVNIEYLNMQRPIYPQDKFDKGLDAMGKAMQDGKMTLEQVIAQCQKTGDLTQEMIAALENVAPIKLEDEE